MTGIIIFLLACNVLFPMIFVFSRCFLDGKVEFNHVLLFSIGYLVYWIFPCVVGESRLFSSSEATQTWYAIFDRVSSPTIALYLLMCLGIYGSFCGGTLLSLRRRPGSLPDLRRFFFDRRLLNIFLGLGLTAAAVYIVVLRNDFFKGYTAADMGENSGPRGSFVAVSLFLLSLAFLYSLKRQEGRPDLGFRQAVSHHFFFCYFAVAILALSLGSRLNFVSSVLMLLVYRTMYFRRIGYRALLLFVSAAFALTGTIGIVRLGGGVTSGDALFNLAAEPLYNSFSMLQFLADGRFDLINKPIFLLGDLINLVPTVLFPAKAAFLLNPEDYGYRVFSPVGSLSSFFSFMINFGILGTMLVMFFTGFVLQSLRSRGSNLLSRTSYIMVCGWLATTFFRDPFSVSLVKSIFQYSILFPAIVVFTAGLTTFWLVEAPRRAAQQNASAALEKPLKE